MLAGSVNGSGVVEIETVRAGDATVLGTLLRRAEEAARARPAIAHLAERAAAWFIAAVLLLATGVAAWWLLHEPEAAIPVVVAVLVVTCPCALALATPAAMIAALGALARAGLIVTGENAVERLALATHCLADKTGTLTEGKFRLRALRTLADVTDTECLRIATALERYASHPIAAAFAGAADRAPDKSGPYAANTDDGHCAAAQATSTVSDRGHLVEDVATHSDGVAGRIGDVRYAIGSAEFVARICAPPPSETESGKLENAVGWRDDLETIGKNGVSVRTGSAEADTHVLLARHGELLARFVFADASREGARDLVEGLGERGIETTIASGDRAGAVDRVADALGVSRRLPGLSPEDKLREAARLADRGERVLMHGDGVNDVPAIAGAHVSVAMGRGAAAAATRADAVLVGDDPRVLLTGIDIARNARRVVKQNLAWAAGYNLIALPLAASGAVPPWAAAIGMSLSSLAVAGNALRLGRAQSPGN